ncbi:MAG: NAD-dependent protein deacylase [Bacteroidales bacterium]|nr:NAD-dependent protein deacylase [Candidatus Cacconaster scatequi]
MAEKRKLVVLSGSGISAESGISTFRGGNGLWDNVPVEEICTPEGWYRNPGKVLDFYNKRRAQLSEVEPNDAHRIIVELENSFDVGVITQNVDNLHERAGSRNVLHLHGELTKVRPEDCYTDRDGYSMKYVSDIGYRPVNMGETGGPRSRQLRPHIVWFGEAVPNLEKAAAIVQEADILLVIGTSMQVYPAAMLHRYAPSKCRIYMIDPADEPAGAIWGVTHIKDVATSGMRKFRDSVTAE